MHATGTQRQLAVLAAFRVKPEASQVEIAKAAGVTAAYVSTVLDDYFGAKAHERDGQVAVRTTPKPAETDVATFAPDRRFGGNAGPVACTAKQQSLRSALAVHPREKAEPKMKYCRRIAVIAGVSVCYVHATTKIIECENIGAELRAKEEARRKVEIVPRVVSLGPVHNFNGWLDAFSKFKATAEAYLILAQTRGDVYASAFLKDIRDTADRAQSRAAISKTD
jgi:hypothetical protein